MPVEGKDGDGTRLLMTSQTVAPSGGGAALMDLRYNYHAAANNGRIESMQDLVTGETVSYQYDALQRLISATAGTAWGNAYSYDGFGNLLSKTVTAGTAPTLSVNVDGTTNRITTAGYTYDLNGNLTAVPGVTGMAYDVDNRLTSANGEAYAYTPVNQRVWLRKLGGTERFSFYDLNGQRLAQYTPWVNGGTLYFVQVKAELYFGGKRIRSGGYAVAEDRLGSTRRDDTTASRFYPWGEENGSTANDRQKFATYYRDAGTALDYANQRYYSATVGRFLTPDPYLASGGPADPGSWNRYGYVEGDPANYTDPDGLFKAAPYNESPIVFRVDVWAVAPRPLSPIEFGILVAQTSRGLNEIGAGRQRPVLSNRERAEIAYDRVRGATHRAAELQSIFTGEQLDCIAGIETGRTWNPNIVARNGRIGMFQFNQNSWGYSGTDISWDEGAPAKDPYTAAVVALGLLTRNLGYNGVANPTEAAITKAIDNFGEGDGRYGQAVMDCAKQFAAGNFEGGYAILYQYATWVSRGRP